MSLIQLARNRILTCCSFKSLCYGNQTVSKFREADESANVITVFVCCLRFPALSTDIVISLNSPVYINPASCSAEEVNYVAMAEAGSRMHETFSTIVQSFAVQDLAMILP